MKHIKITLFTTIFIISLSACSSHSPSTQESKKQKGWMQEHLDSWLEEDWNPTTKKVEEKYHKDENQSSFTLQEYVDKAVVYCKEHPDTNDSHIEQLNQLPVIGR